MTDLFLVEASKEYQKSFQNYALAYKNINNEHYFKIASRKIIEKNNGKLLETIYDKEDNEYLYKYVIMRT